VTSHEQKTAGPMTQPVPGCPRSQSLPTRARQRHRIWASDPPLAHRAGARQFALAHYVNLPFLEVSPSRTWPDYLWKILPYRCLIRLILITLCNQQPFRCDRPIPIASRCVRVRTASSSPGNASSNAAFRRDIIFATPALRVSVSPAFLRIAK
jgi:hypothetical protein